MPVQSNEPTRELLRVEVGEDGSLHVLVSATWTDDPANEKPARVSKAVAAAIVGVLGGESQVPVFFRLNQPQ